jgi:hypothetical protein
MDNDNKTPSGAPSDDTTSALFVSARKKQLEQQEADRRAKEKEEQRLAAEAEVRRLEWEVAERRRQAEEEVRRVEFENAERRRIAEEEARRTGQAGGMGQPQQPYNPNAAPGAWQQPAQKQPKAAKPPAQGGGLSNLMKNKKLLAIVGGGAAVVIILVVVLIVTLGGGNKGNSGNSLSSGSGREENSGTSSKVDPDAELSNWYDENGISFSYPSGWSIVNEMPYPPAVMVESDYRNNGRTDIVYFFDVTNDFYDYLYNAADGDVLFAGELMLDEFIIGITNGGDYAEYFPAIEETYNGFVSGGTEFTYTTTDGIEYYLFMDIVPFPDRLLLVAFELPQRKNIEDGVELCYRIGYTATLEGDSEYSFSDSPEYHDLNSRIYFQYPDGWLVRQQAGASTMYAPVIVTQYEGSSDFMMLYIYTEEFHDFMRSGQSGMDNLIADFADTYLLDSGYDFFDLYNVEYGEAFYNSYGNEVIIMKAESDYAYYAFIVVKKFTEPQQLAAAAIQTATPDVLYDFVEIAGSLDLR